MNAYRGLTFIISQGKQVTGYELPPGTTDFVAEGVRLGGVLIPWLVVISLLLALAFYLILKYTHFGREVYAVGSNREAAYLRGINCKKTEFLVFTIVGALCGITAMIPLPASAISTPATRARASSLWSFPPRSSGA